MKKFKMVLILPIVIIPAESRAYEIIDELSVRGIQLDRFISNIPYKLGEVTEEKSEIEYLREDMGLSDAKMLLDRLDYLDDPKSSVKVYSIGYGLSDTISRYFQDGGFIASPGEVAICVQPFIKFGESDEHPTYRWYDKMGGDLRRSYGCVEIGDMDILLGREIIKWGPPSANQLILSGTSPAFDMLYISYEHNFFKGTFFVTSLDPYILRDTVEFWRRDEVFPEGTKINRFFSGHRLDFSLFDNRFLIGISEVIIYSGEGISLISGYLNPFNLYYRYRLNRGGSGYSDNVGVGLDFSYNVRDGLCIYGQLFVDDAKFEKDEYNNPTTLGYCAGLKACMGKSFWNLRYTRVDTWTYIHQLYWNDYLFLDYPIGHPKGQDLDEIFGRLVFHLNYTWDLSLDLCYTRRGVNNFQTLWQGVFPEHQEFPSGVIERSLNTKLGVSFFALPRLSFHLALGYTVIRDYQHIEEHNRSFPSVGLEWSSLIF